MRRHYSDNLRHVVFTAAAAALVVMSAGEAQARCWSTVTYQESACPCLFACWGNGYDYVIGQTTVTSLPKYTEALNQLPAGCEGSSCGGQAYLCKGDPVYLHSGQFAYQCDDLTVPGRKLDVDIKHTYNSGAMFNGPFGYGWQINYYQRLHVLRNGDAVIVSGDGQKTRYTVSGTSYIPPAGHFASLVKNADSTWTLTEAHGDKYEFDAEGRLAAIKDRNNNTIQLVYSPEKMPHYGRSAFAQDPSEKILLGMDYRLTEIRGSNGRVIGLRYNTDGLLEKIVDAEREVVFNYDPQTNDLLSVTRPAVPEFPDGVAKSFVYQDHKVKKIQDAKLQYFVENVYDTEGRVKQQVLGSGSYHFDYSVANQVTETDRKGHVTKYIFNANGNLLSEVKLTEALRPDDPASFTTNYTYNADSLKTSVTYPKGNGLKFVYDESNASRRSRGNLLQVRRKADMTLADNDTNDIVVKSTYEPQFNQPKTMTDALGKMTTYLYDYELPVGDPRRGTAGNLVRVAYPTVAKGTPEVNFAYNAYGQIEQVTDANAKVTRFTYYPDTGYLKETIKDLAGVNAITLRTYDAYGNLDLVTDPEQRTTDYDFNALGWLKQVRTQLGFVTKYGHDANGNVTTIERQANLAGTQWQSTVMDYDVLNHLKTVKDPLERLTTYNYDESEQIASVVDAESKITTYEYDERGLLFKVKDANTPQGVTQTDYDVNGNPKRITDANTNPTNYTFDRFDRLWTETFADTTYRELTYDKNGNVKVERLPDARTIESDYDELNRLTARRYPSTPTLNASFDYDLGSNLTDANNAAALIHNTYDDLNRLDTTTTTLNGSLRLIDYDYYKDDRLKQVVYPSTRTIDWTYDDDGRPDLVKDGGATLADYDYDPLGRLKQKSFPTISTESVYGFDLADQLGSIIHRSTLGPTVSQYAYPLYDRVGNRKALTKIPATGSPETTNYVYNDIYELTTVTGAQTHNFVYDNVGNRTTADGTAYTPNVLNQYDSVGLTSFAYDDNGNLTSDGTRSLVYNEENQLTTAGGSSYQYDALGRRIAKTVNGATTYYLNDGDHLIAEYDAANSLQAEYVEGPTIDDHLAMSRDGAHYFYLQDGLGSVTEVLSDTGVIAEEYSYDVYGQPSVTNSTIGNPYRFTGRAYDEETGLYHYRARMYDPATGRFLQRDPIAYSDGMDLYAYVHNNPVNYIDPLGLFDYRQAFIESAKGGVSGAIGGAILGASSIPTPYTAGGGALIGGGLGIVGGFIKGGLSDSEVKGGKVVGGALGGAFQGAVAGPVGAGIGAGLGALEQAIPRSNSGSNAVDVTNEVNKQGILGCLGGADSGILGCIVGAGSGMISGTVNEGINQCSK